MHEMSLVEAIMESLVPLCSSNGWNRVEKVVLRVGTLRQVVPEALVFCFETASAGTPLEGASLDIKEIPLRQSCRSCGEKWGGDQPLGRCPCCGSVETETVSGLELEIESLEVAVDENEKG